MVCVPGKEKAESITERVSGMKKESIERLLDRNANEQLAGFDWDRLNKSISDRLDRAGGSRTFVINYGNVFKIAAGIAVAAAAVVIIAILVRTEPPGTRRFENDGKAVVTLIENAGSASVEIKQKSAGAALVIDTQMNRKNLAVCEIEIINSNADNVTNASRAAWIIIRVPEPVLVDDGQSRDEADLACLL